MKAMANLVRGPGWAVVLALLVPALAAPSASATFHEVSIRELYPGSGAQPDSEYIELQMWSPDQHFVKGHSITTYDESGAPVDTTTFSADVAAGSNQRTILAATPTAESEFGVNADVTMTAGQLDAGGGAICWESLDCVSWGTFSGSLPNPAGSPAAPSGIPDGMALRRSILPGCATLLEPGDDRDNSAADFAAVFPDPRPNSVSPGERPCAGSGGPSGGPGNQDRGGAPQTLLGRKPPRRTRDRTPSFRFSSDEAGGTFQCKLDKAPFRSCRSPFTARKLTLGRHTFKVRARDATGKLDPSPASHAFNVLAKRQP